MMSNSCPTCRTSSAAVSIGTDRVGEPPETALIVGMTDLSRVTGTSAAETKAAAATARADLTRRVVEADAAIAEARQRMKEEREALEAVYRARMAEIAETIAPLKAELAKLEEVAWTVDLYLGRDEQVDLIADGSPAPAETPITIRQCVLAADEESIALLDSGGVDFRTMDAFVDWLTADPANRDRVIPDLRGVVVVVPTRQRRDYHDSWTNVFADDKNKQAHWIIRNGERLYLLRTDPQLVVGDRLTPRVDEFESFFSVRGRDGEPRMLEPGSAEWIKAEQAADARRRHFMRVFLILQGLVDRTVCFHPLPDGGVNLLSVAAQNEGKVVIVNELDNVLGDGREPFREWQMRLNALLRPGMRVVCAFSSSAFRGMSDTRSGHDRIYPPHASYPPSGVPLLVEAVDKGMFVVRYERNDEVWRSGVEVPGKPGWVYRGLHPVKASKRASVRLLPTDTFVIPFDLATTDELNYYLNRRSERRSYLSVVPVIKAALVAKLDEQRQEAPMRQHIRDVLVVQHGGDPDVVDGELDALVQWWKLANKWSRPLVGDGPEQAKAVAAIVKEWKARRGAAASEATDAVVVAAARREIPNLLWVAHGRSSRYLAFAASGSGPWVDSYRVGADGTVTLRARWTTVHPSTLRSARTVWQSPERQSWPWYPDVSSALTGPERDVLVEATVAELAAAGTAVVVTEVPASNTFIGYARKPADGAGTGEALDDHLASVKVVWARSDGKVKHTVRTASPRWERYRHDDGQTGPWLDVPADRKRDHDHRLVWSDPVQLGIVDEVAAAVRHAVKVRREEIRRYRSVAETGVDLLRSAWLARAEATAKARFVEDFGDQSEDLWLHHLGTLRLDRAWVTPSWAYPMFERLAKAGVEVAGKSVADLAVIDAGLHTGAPVDPGDFGPLVLAPPP